MRTGVEQSLRNIYFNGVITAIPYFLRVSITRIVDLFLGVESCRFEDWNNLLKLVGV